MTGGRMDDREVRNRIVEKLLRSRTTGSKKQSIDTVVSNYLPSHEEGRGKRLIAEMITNPEAPIEAYGGGHRENVRLTSVEDATEYLRDNGGNVPFGFGNG